jgi:thiamine-phosphate pyrophosphorylase
LRGLYALVSDASGASEAIRGGAGAVQIRMKGAGDGAVLEVIRQAVAAGNGPLVLVNDRPDLASLGGADGVHLGEEDLPLAEARALVGPELLIGATCRDLDGARRAIAAGADYLGYGPLFGTRSKALDEAPRGLPALAALCAAVPLPVVAIGGITRDTMGAVAAAGAAAAAVLGDLRPGGAARAGELAAAFGAAR